MFPVISIVGKKNSGKTTLLIELIKELKERGYSVGIIKHIHHDIEISDVDKEGTDSFKHFKTGADVVVVAGNRLLALFQNLTEKKTIAEITHLLPEINILLTEGFKIEKMPKIEVVREDEPICKKEDNLVAIVSDKFFNLDIPHFGFNEYEKIADFIENDFIKKKSYKETFLFIDGKNILLNGFVQKIFKETILGMIRTLHKIPENPKKIEIKIM